MTSGIPVYIGIGIMNDATKRSIKSEKDLNKCLCGERLHYSNSKQQERVQVLIDKLGDCVEIRFGNESYFVPRHYVALHGIKMVELPILAKRYNLKVK